MSFYIKRRGHVLHESANGGCTVAFLLLMFIALFGWVWNIFKIVSAINDPITALIIFRIAGVLIWPLGCVLGWL